MEHAGQQPNLAKMSESDFRLEEPWQDIRGLDVYDGNGEQIGSVDDLYVDRDSRLPRFLIVSAGGFLGVGKKHFLFPVEEVSRDMGEDRVTVNQNRDKVVNSPDFDPDEVPPRFSTRRPRLLRPYLAGGNPVAWQPNLPPHGHQKACAQS